MSPDLQNEGIQRHPVDFRYRVRREGVVVGLSVQTVTHSRARAARATLPLLRARTTDPELLQALHLGFGIKTHFLDFSC